MLALAVVLQSATAATEPARSPCAGRTIVVTRGQMKYGLDETYLRCWVDRPLFQDSSLPAGSPACVMHLETYARMLEILGGYGLDGFAFLPETTRRACVFDLQASAPPSPLRILPEFVPNQDLAAKTAVLDAALASRVVIRLDGRIPITAYRTDALPAADWAPMLAQFRRQYRDAFIFLPDLSGGWQTMMAQYHSGTAIGPEDMAAQRERLRSYLDVFDGFYFGGAAGMKAPGRTFDAGFYRDVVIPTALELLQEPAYRDKFFGLSACIGHENCTRLGYTLSHDGTKTLRRSFETALAARPDLIVIPEWDEQNENTSLRPTVYNGRSTQRLMRHYMQQLRGEPLSMLPGDDPAAPNLVLSYRKILTLGEALQLEILNIPDTPASVPFTVRAELLDLQGKALMTSPVYRFRGTLEDHTWIVPTELLARQRVVLPRLLVDYHDLVRQYDEGLHHVRLRATWNWDYKWVKQPLRDLYSPPAHRFDLAPTADGLWRVAASVAGPLSLRSVEVLDEDMVVYAAAAGSSWRDRDDLMLLSLEWRSFRRGRLRGSMCIAGAAAVWRQPLPDWAQLDAAAVRLDTSVDWYLRQLFVGVPAAAAPDAVIEVDTDLMQARIPVAQVAAGGIFSETGDDGLTLTVTRYLRQPAHPAPLNRSQVDLAARVIPDQPGAVMHLRAITSAGGIYRSRPAIAAAADYPKITLPIWSDTQDRPVQVTVAADRVPDIVYRFTPDRGSVMYCDAGRHFWGQLGGFTDSVTARGGNGGLDGSPFVRRDRYPDAARRMAPSWTTVDDSSCLQFDGIGNFIALPQGVLPRRAPFTLRFEIRPDDVDRAQVLFAHHGTYIGSLVLRLSAGKLRGHFVNDELTKFSFVGETILRNHQWTTVQLSYDLSQLRLWVDGAPAARVPCHGPGLYDTTSVFGGYGAAGDSVDYVGAAGWFKGQLRSLEIAHRPWSPQP